MGKAIQTPDLIPKMVSVAPENMAAKSYGHGYTSRILITGISGFVGSQLAEALIEDGHTVAGFLRYSPRVAENIKPILGKCLLYYADIRDYSTTSWVMRQFQPEYVIHLAGLTPVSYSFEHPQETTEINYLGTINLAEICKRELPGLKKFIFASTMEVYGQQDRHRPFTEKTAPNPVSPYAVAKYAAEKYLQYMHANYNFPFTVTRSSNIFGRKNDTYFITETVINQILTSKQINLGNSRPIRNYIYIKDVVNLFRSLINAPAKKVTGQIFNSGPDNPLSVEEYVQAIAKAANWKGRINWNTRELRSGEVEYLNTSNSKVSAAIGWEPKYSLEAGLKETIVAWRNKIKHDADVKKKPEKEK